MSRLSFRKKWSDLSRLRFILGVLFEHGGGFFLEKINLKYLVPLRCRVHCLFHSIGSGKCKMHGMVKADSQTFSPQVLRSMLEILGPTFIKLGQILSLRADLVGEDISKELSKLQSSVPPFPYSQVREIVKKELGKYPEQLFKSFEKQPVAAASLSQVHRAVTKKGKKIALKIQRPDIKKTIEQDIHILFYLAHLFEKFIPESRIYRPHEVVKEFAEWTMRELDFRMEGHNMDRFHAMFEDNEYINIPVVYWDYTTSRVLAMDFIDGLKADNLSGMKRRKINPKEVALHGIDALLRQFFIEGFFHADPHPGNFFALKGDILCLHDFGMVGQLTQKQRQELLSCFVAFVNKDIESYQKHFLHLAQIDEKTDIDAYKKDITHILNEFFYSPKQPSIAWAFFRLINAGGKRGVRFPSDLVLFAKALVTTESMGLTLYPKFDFNKHFRPFVKKAYKEYLNPKKVIKTLEADFFDYAEMLKTLPQRTSRMIEKIEQGEVGVKLDAEDLMGIKKEFDRQNDVRVLGIVLTAIVIVTGVLFHLEGKRTLLGIPLTTFGSIVSILLLIWFVSKIRSTPKS